MEFFCWKLQPQTKDTCHKNHETTVGNSLSLTCLKEKQSVHSVDPQVHVWAICAQPRSSMLHPNPPGFDINIIIAVWVSKWKWINPTWINSTKLTKFTERRPETFIYLNTHTNSRKHARKFFSSSCNKEPIVEFCVLCVAGWYNATENLQQQ